MSHTHTATYTHKTTHTHTYTHMLPGGCLLSSSASSCFPEWRLFSFTSSLTFTCVKPAMHVELQKKPAFVGRTLQRTPLQSHSQTHTLHCHNLHAYIYAGHTRKYTRARTYANTRARIPPPPPHTPARAAATRSALVVLPVPGVPVIKTLGNCPTLCVYAHQPKIPCFSG